MQIVASSQLVLTNLFTLCRGPSALASNAQFMLQLQICKLLLEENLHLGQQSVVPENIYNFLLHGRVVSKDPLHPTNLLVSLLPPPPPGILVLFVEGVGKSEYSLELHNLQSKT